MSPEERQLLAGLFERIQGMANAPRDREAEAMIADATRTMPYAPYLLSQTVIVQEQALRAAADKLQELETRVRTAEARQPAPQESGGFLSGIGKSLFGGGEPPRPAPRTTPNYAPQPGYGQGGGYAPQQAAQPGPWGQPAAMQGGGMGAMQGMAPQGGGFLKGALGAAAGVAGGVLLADSIRGLMGGHNSPLGIGSGFGGGTGGGETTINNYYEDGPHADQAALDHQQDLDQDQDDGQDAADNSGSDDDSTDV